MIEVQQHDRVFFVRPAQDILATTLPELKQRLTELMAQGAQEVRLDLVAVTMLDSVGLGFLAATHNSMKKLGGTLVLENLAADVAHLFESMRLSRYFQIID